MSHLVVLAAFAVEVFAAVRPVVFFVSFVSFVFALLFVSLVFAFVFLTGARAEADISNARWMIDWNILPVSPPLAGALLIQMSGVLPDRISAKSAFGVLTLSGANSVMLIGPDQSSRCLITSQLRPSPAPWKPRVRTSTHEPFSL